MMMYTVALLAAAPLPPAPPVQQEPGKPAPSQHIAGKVPQPSPRRARPRVGIKGGVALGAVQAANRAATMQPSAAGYINAVQVYPFGEGLVYRLYTRPGRVTDLALEAGETLVSVASGDTTRWAIGDTVSGGGNTRRTHVLVKPFAADLSTNLVIATDRRTYHLDLVSSNGAAIAAVSWTYPQDALIALKRAPEAAAPASTTDAPSIEQLRFGYRITGDRPAWRPLRAFDDGRQTYIEFPASLAVGEAPPLFLVDGRGDAQLVNYRLRGRYYVVDRLFDLAELRLGTKRQQVVRISRARAADAEKAS